MYDSFRIWHAQAKQSKCSESSSNSYNYSSSAIDSSRLQSYAKLGSLILKYGTCQNCVSLRKRYNSSTLDKNSHNNNNSSTKKQTHLTTATQSAPKMNFHSHERSSAAQTSFAMPTSDANRLLDYAHMTNGGDWYEALNTTSRLEANGDNVTLSAVIAASASSASAAPAYDFNNAPFAGNLTYFAPAISHVMLAPTTANAVTALEQDLLPAVVANNGTAAGAGADSSDNLNSFYFYETEQFAVLWILFTVIVLGNSAVLFVMFLNKNRKSRMNYFIKQLALADLCVGLLNVLTDIIWRITISWRAGNVACKVIRFSQVCVTYSSTYVLVAMSIDRYDAITHPMNFSKSWKRARQLVASAWIISAVFSLPILLLYEEKMIQGQKQCWIDLGSPWAWQLYMSLVSATLFALPALIISACYAIIVKTIWAKGSIFVPAERAGYNNPSTRRASSRGIIPRAKVKTVKMTFVIVIVFIVCWSPYIVFDLLQVFGHIPKTQTNIAIATFIQSLAPLNSAANPLIYCLFSSQVFRTLSRFPPFKWFTCCCKSYRNNSTQNRCNTVGRRLHNSCDSMRTLTTSLTVSRRSNKAAAARVVICERSKTTLAISEV